MGPAGLALEPTALKLKLVSGEGKWRSPVTIGIVQYDFRNFRNSKFHIHIVTFFNFDVAVFLQLVQNSSKGRSQEDLI